MMTVKQVQMHTGVSIRTLQYYDRIGLLKASAYTPSGYRLYDGEALARLQQILLYRELEFPLKDIQKILCSPDYDRKKALEQQITLLQMKREHLQRLIDLARGIYTTGDTDMDFSAFDKSKQERYAREAKAQWGNTPAYEQFAQRKAARDETDEEALGQGLLEIFARLGKLREGDPACADAQQLVQQLRDYITEHYYTCTPQILRGLGQMYACGGEFTENIDASGGPGTARFAGDAIGVYCENLT